MNNLTLKLTVEETRLLISLATDQLFRREFIDPKMPGCRPNRAETDAGKALVARMRTLIAGEAEFGGPRNSTAATQSAEGPQSLPKTRRAVCQAIRSTNE